MLLWLHLTMDEAIYNHRFVNLIILIVLFALAIFFSTYKLAESPPVWYDEGWYIQTSANLAAGYGDGIQLAPGDVRHISILTVGYPLIYPLAAWFNIFGTGVISARSLMVVFILALLIAIYSLVRRIWWSGADRGTMFGIFVVALLVTFPPLYGNGKSVLGEVPGLLYMVIFLLCFSMVRSGIPRKYLWIILAGLFAGICIVTKPLFLVLIPAIAIGVLIEWRRGTMTVKESLIMAVAGVLPIAVWFLVQFQAFDSPRQILAYYANPYQIDNLTSVIAGNFVRLFSDPSTLYLLAVMAVWFVALIIRWKKREMIQSEEIIAFIFTLLISAAFLRTAGWFRYLFPVQIVSLIFFPASLSYIGRIFTRVKHSNHAVSIVIGLLVILGGYQVMFNSWVANAYSNDKTEFWQKYFVDTDPEETVFFYDAPEVAIFIPHRNYYQYLAPAGGDIGSENLRVLVGSLADKVILETDAYVGGQKTTFSMYEEQERAYKYSILKLRNE